MAEVWAVKIQKFIRKQNSLKLGFPWKRSVPVAQLQFEEDSTREGEEDAKKGYHGSMHFGQNSVGDGVTPSVRTYGLRPPDGLLCTGKSLSEGLLFAENGENMLCTEIVLNVKNNFCTQPVLPMFWAWNFHVHCKCLQTNDR